MDFDYGSSFTSTVWVTSSLITFTLTTASCKEIGKKTGSSGSSGDTANTTLVANTQSGKLKSKTIYLTFDDGPNAGTPKVMDILDAEKMPATMFLIGEHVTDSKEQHATYERITATPALEIANHSYTHGFHNHFNKYYSMPSAVLADFKKCADSLQLTSNIVRTPGRNIWRLNDISLTDLKNSKSAADSLKAAAYKVIGWDLEWRFNNQLKLLHTADQMVAYVDTMFMKEKLRTHDHLVFLMHDKTFVDATDSTQLHNFIRLLKQKNEYNFDILSNYPGVK